MTPPILQIESCNAEKKLEEVINGKIQICSEKFSTNFEEMEPSDQNSTTFNFLNGCAEFALLLRICTDIVCFLYTTSAPIEVASLFFFIVSLLGLVFTFLFIVRLVWNVMRKSKNGDQDYKFEVVFCVTWSILYGFFTTLVAIFNQPVILPVFCGYFSMICYALDGYWKCTREKKSDFENFDAELCLEQRYCPIQSYESNNDNKPYTVIYLYNKINNSDSDVKHNTTLEEKS